LFWFYLVGDFEGLILFLNDGVIAPIEDENDPIYIDIEADKGTYHW
jgi:hypothetical protein